MTDQLVKIQLPPDGQNSIAVDTADARSVRVQVDQPSAFAAASSCAARLRARPRVISMKVLS
jgi:hypothetical protein